MLRPAPLLLMPELLCIALLVFFLRRALNPCNVAINEYPIFYYVVSTLFSLLFFLTTLPGLLYLSCLGIVVICPFLSS